MHACSFLDQGRVLVFIKKSEIVARQRWRLKQNQSRYLLLNRSRLSRLLMTLMTSLEPSE